MTEPTRYRVTRLPGAPARRAGRLWPEGESQAVDLTPAQLADIAADPLYRLEPLAPPETGGVNPPSGRRRAKT
jgi:hypothetical protein